MDKEFALEHSPRQPLYDNLPNYPSVKFDDIKTGYYYLRFMKYKYDFIVHALKYDDYVATTFAYLRLRDTDDEWEEIPWLDKQNRNLHRKMIDSGFITFYNYSAPLNSNVNMNGGVRKRKTQRKYRSKKTRKLKRRQK